MLLIEDPNYIAHFPTISVVFLEAEERIYCSKRYPVIHKAMRVLISRVISREWRLCCSLAEAESLLPASFHV